MKLKMMQLNSNCSQSKKPNWVAPFLGWSFLKEIKLKMMQLNSNWSQSNKMCVTADWKKKPNWVAPCLGWSFLKEMKLKMMQLNSNWAQSKSQIELHLFWVEVFLKKWNSKWCNLIQTGLSLLKAKLSCTFFGLYVSKRNEIENDAT